MGSMYINQINSLNIAFRKRKNSITCNANY